MFDRKKHFTARLLPLLIGLGAAGAAIGAGQAGASDGPLRCEIRATAANGMIALEGVAHAETSLGGSYRFKVAGGGAAGSSNIEQAGDFTAGPRGAASLGKMTLGGGRSAVYDVELSLTAKGRTVRCAERIGGTI